MLIIRKGRHINPVLFMELVYKGRNRGLENTVSRNAPDGFLKPFLFPR